MSGLRVGAVLYGFCGGHFGRDSYEDKRIEAVGEDWIVCRDEYGDVHTADFSRRGDGWTLASLERYLEPSSRVRSGFYEETERP